MSDSKRVWFCRNKKIIITNGFERVECDIPYVPEAGVEAVWEKAIAVLHEVPRKTIGSRDDYAVMEDRKQLLAALEAVRESEKQG